MTVSYKQVQPLDTEWLWYRRIPRGELTSLTGEGGVAKGRTLGYFASLVSRGVNFPGEPAHVRHTPGTTVMITPEDDLNKTVVKRLMDDGANLDYVLDLSELDDGTPFELSSKEHLAILEETIKDPGKTETGEPRPPVQLVILDPVDRCTTKELKNNSTVATLLKPVEDIARTHNISVLLSYHTTKGGIVAGAKAVTDIPRANWLLKWADQAAEPGVRILSCLKANCPVDKADLRMTVEELDDEHSRVVWLTGRPGSHRRRSVVLRERWHAFVVIGGTVTELGRHAEIEDALEACLQSGYAAEALDWQRVAADEMAAQSALATFRIRDE